ncbi:DUF2272 domain-containing protein [Methylococcus sp. EFPC2]|uniref:DUF2272 domain-containing protein n=1 Tax=Methylococcus sp. EFPC2 TaxID=2812648 RepID=UPI0019679195|nr:DUF2272 domain-containing protein [Methylococcus sp. EFPC2]QSA96024.1 DUF2272 domain-containing protein [Methylococcus sp. EFPC2]
MSKLYALWIVCFWLVACGTAPKKPAPPPKPPSEVQAAVPSSPTPAPGSTVERIVSLALGEWDYFGRQVVTIAGDEEAIPHVGDWEDEDGDHSERVARYWQAVGRSRLSGSDCQQPWSAAFVSWVMTEAGLPESAFPPADAHWVYLDHLMKADGPDAPFRPHPIEGYPPRPGDLICATRGPGAPWFDGLPRTAELRYTKLHCDIVVESDGKTLDAIGGNVRNSVSKTRLQLNPEGHLQPSIKRPWFLVLENRLVR